MSLVLENIGLKVNNETIIDDVSLTLERGTMNVLLGPTLAGKTSLMRLMAGLDKPTSGRLLLDGKDVTRVAVRDRSVAMVYQQFVNYPSLSVYENIASPLRVAKLADAEVKTRVAEAAKLLHLEKLLDRLPGQLSGGQQQRTAIARALVKRADVVLLDEPLANLDYKLREELRQQLPKIFAEFNAILVYATTEPMEALLLGGKTATLWQGRVTQHGETPLVYRRPDNVDAAQVFSDPPLNIMSFTKRGSAISLADGGERPLPAHLAGLTDGTYQLGFRSDDITVGAVGGGTAGVLSFSGSVAVTELSGSESFLHVDVGAGRWVCLIRGVHDWQPGAAVDVHVHLDRAFVFQASGGGKSVPLAAVGAA